MKLEEKENKFRSQIFQIENEYQNSLNKKTSEIMSSAQNVEEQLLSELQILDDKLKLAEFTIIKLNNEIENQRALFEKEKNLFIQNEKLSQIKLNEKEQKEAKVNEENYNLKSEIFELNEELQENIQHVSLLENQNQEQIKTIINLKNQILEKDLKLAKISELNENLNLRKENISYDKQQLLNASPSSPNPIKILKNIETSLVSSKNTTEIKNLSSNKEKKEEEVLSISNFDDLESSHSNSLIHIDANKELFENEDEKIKKENILLTKQNRSILEKNELLLLFLREKEEEISKLTEKIHKIQILNEEYENEISNLRNEIKRNHESKPKSDKIENNIQNMENETKIKDLERKLIQTKEEWANLVNFLNEELSLAERAAVEAKTKYVEEASQKEFFQFKYNFLLSKMKK